MPAVGAAFTSLINLIMHHPSSTMLSPCHGVICVGQAYRHPLELQDFLPLCIEFGCSSAESETSRVIRIPQFNVIRINSSRRFAVAEGPNKMCPFDLPKCVRPFDQNLPV